MYNFNHRYILTLRDQKIQNNNIVQMLYIYYHIFTWNKYLIHRTIGLNTWWRNLCWQAQRSDICCSFSSGLHRSWEGFWSTPLCRSSPNLSGSEAVTWQLKASAPSRDFRLGFRSGDWLGHSRTLICFFLSHSFVALAVCFGSLSCWKTHEEDTTPRDLRRSLTLLCLRHSHSRLWLFN